MTTLNKLAHRVIRHLSAGTKTKDSKISNKYVQESIIQATNAAIKKEYYNTLNSGDRDVQAIAIATYDNQPVLEDSISGRNYIALPAYYVPLPGGVGIQEVRPMVDGKTGAAMIPLKPNELELFADSLTALEIFKDQFCWEPDRDKIFFTERDSETLLDASIENVQVKLCVVDPSKIDENDFFPISPDMEGQIIMSVLIEFGYTTKEVADLINNGNPNIK